MAGILHKIEETFGGKKEEQHKGEPHAGPGQHGQQGHNPQGHNAQGEHKEGFVDKIKDKIPGVGGGAHKGETQGHNPQGGYGQQGHDAHGERKEGFVDKFKDKIPGVGDEKKDKMAGIMHKIEQTLNFGGKKGKHRGQTQGGFGQQGHTTQGLVARIKHMIPGGRRTGGVGGVGGGGQWKHERVKDVEHIKNHFKDLKKKKKRKAMAGMMNKTEGQFAGKKEEQRKGEPQGGHGQQVHNTQGDRQEGFVDKIKEKIPGGGCAGGGDKHQGDTQGGCNQPGHNTQGERKEGFGDQMKDKIPGHGRLKDVEVAFTGY
ncbi:hypothetical protein SADUNF_Sadunf13G0051500 [Salix dunnii]|uniref:Uncharacterized protein n=1 Tax=Salix dunnii TaxID=1413687 RepID=A0A835JKW0_9ROSI|nr:hypothetical protein SADUNF_Sadunf13G0051500 [Salix dunnii]